MATNIIHPLRFPPPFEQQQQRYFGGHFSPAQETDVTLFEPLPFQEIPPGHASTLSTKPRQYAFPAALPASQEASTKTTGRLSFAEHALRRKTPNGTIAAGYDATPVDRSIPLPAAKHILVSSLPERPSMLTARSAIADASAQERLGNGLYLGALNSGPRGQAPPTGPYSQVHGYSTTPLVPTYQRWEFPGGLDSVLNQTLPMQPSGRYYVQNGSSVPTALPTNLQGYPDPTASAGNEFYGRYSPNEAFVPFPYQPAPIRDGRYFETATANTRTASNQLPPNWTQHSFHDPSTPWDQLGWRLPANRCKDMAGFEHMPTDSLSPGYSIPPSRNSLLSQQGGQVVRFRQPPQQHSSSGCWPLPEQPGNPQVSSMDYGTATESADFREKVFRWAHHLYVALLASIHKSRSLNASDGNVNSPGLSKPNIFPKPPRQPGSNFSTPPKDEESSPSHSSSRKRPRTIYSPSQRQTNSWHQGAVARPNSGRLPSFSEHYNDRYSGVPDKSPNTFQGPLFTASGECSIEQIAGGRALELLADFCEKSKRYWIEGMLLAGCLAYGLGDYAQALDWYQAVLSRDSRHVEAMSNLAATFLALNRRDEAMQQWKQAVKLRPSYFEAVEHLIGLLCGNQQTLEAVKVIEYVEQSLRLVNQGEYLGGLDARSEVDSETKSRASSEGKQEAWEGINFDFDEAEKSPAFVLSTRETDVPGFGSSGFAIAGSENGRILGLIHAKGNMLYSLHDNQGAAAAFEEAILIGSGRRRFGIRGLIREILMAYANESSDGYLKASREPPKEPILLYPEKALQTVKMIFGAHGRLPGLEHVSHGMKGQNHKTAVSTTSNSLLSLAKIYQDGLSNAGASGGPKTAAGVRDILALYYLSLSLQPSPSTANNVGILLASVQQVVPRRFAQEAATANQAFPIPGVVPGSGVALALSYYYYGLSLDAQHAHLYTNLGSLLKDIGQLRAAIKMYEQAVHCDPHFDIALANLANAVKDQGMVTDAIRYYKRAVQANPEFAEAVCGLATALNSVCSWTGRGGICADGGKRDRWHVDDRGALVDARSCSRGSGWMNRVVEIVDKQLKDGVSWGRHTLTPILIEQLCQQLTHMEYVAGSRRLAQKKAKIAKALQAWSGQDWEGARLVRLLECATRRIGWQWYQDRHHHGKIYPDHRYGRPLLPASLCSPNAPTVLPFHTFTAPLSARQIRQISQRNGLRISVLSMKSSWLPNTVLPPPAPPKPHLNVGYVSSDFNNHPLAHLMQSVFGLHNPHRVRAFCYATTPSDNSVHRQQIEREAPVFHDASPWNIEKLVKQILDDGIHILINLNGYTRGARNEVFAARPAPIQMSFMGFAGTLGADWCDYILADETTIPPTMLSPWRRNVDLDDRLRPDAQAEDDDDWMYSENIIFAKDTFFCCDHRQSAPDAKYGPPPSDGAGRERAWREEQGRRWRLRKELFPTLSDDAVILGNFNQLYKVDPATFRLYLRILASLPNAILWLLRFPDLGEHHLLTFARAWTPASVANRIVFTDVAPKGTHITRASVVDLFLDTPECNAHTTAADVVWSGTPVLTWGKWGYKMCSRMAGSIVGSALPVGKEGDRARTELLVGSEAEYQSKAVEMARGLKYPTATTTQEYGGSREGRSEGQAAGRLMELRRLLWEGRWKSRLFATRRWVDEVEKAYEIAWAKWERGEGGDIWLDGRR